MTTINGIPVIEAAVSENRNAGWTALVSADTDKPMAPRVTIDMDGEVFVGSVVQGDVEAGRWKGTVVGGAGALGTTLPAAWFVTPTVRDILTALARDSGEVIDPTILPSVLGKRFERWSRLLGETHVGLRQLADALGMEWRITRAGTVWLGEETWPPAVGKYLVESYDPDQRKLTITVEALTERPFARPGLSLDGRHIERVVTTVSAAGLRQEVYFDEEKGQGGMLGLVQRRIREIVMPKLAFAAFYAGKVVGGSGSELTVLMDDRAVAGKWKGLDRVKAVHGLPGVTIEPVNGARVRVFFDGNAPDKPRAALWDSAAPVRRITIECAEELRLVAPTITVDGDLEVTGEVSAAGEVTAMSEATPTMLSQHAHTLAAAPGTSGPPVPVPPEP